MKQHITKKQWDELSKEEYKKFRPSINITEVSMKKWFYEYITIGKMIEFLGDDFIEISNSAVHGWIIKVNPWWNKKHIEKELCDALFEAVKYKLNNN